MPNASSTLACRECRAPNDYGQGTENGKWLRHGAVLRSLPILRRHSASGMRHSAFTLIEVLTVLGIIALVAAMTLPMIVPMMRSRSIDLAADTVKSSLILARSRAVQSRRVIGVTLFQQEQSVVVYDYEDLRTALGVSTTPAVYCPHFVGNYGGDPDVRYTRVKAASISTIRSLPESCAFNLYEAGVATGGGTTSLVNGLAAWVDNIFLGANARVQLLDSSGAVVQESLITGNGPQRLFISGTFNPAPQNGQQYRIIMPRAAWSYLFLPNGSVWTLPPSANNGQDSWSRTTFMDATQLSRAKPTGPLVLGPEGRTSAIVYVLASTGQALTE